MSEIYLGYPPNSIMSWCKEKYGKKLTPYLYCGTAGASHEHKLSVITLSGQVSAGSSGIQQSGRQTCKVSNDTVSNSSITYISADEGCICTKIGDSAFSRASSLASVSVPSVQRIEACAFEFCKSLRYASFQACTVVGAGAFNGCESLAEISLPSCISASSNDTPFSCTALSALHLDSMAQSDVQSKAKYPYGIPAGCVVTCKDGTFTVT